MAKAFFDNKGTRLKFTDRHGQATRWVPFVEWTQDRLLFDGDTGSQFTDEATDAVFTVSPEGL